ncbi:S41 family peptidase [Acrocarpospora catenulata]|uniref:S41 family peptidase n=1 Tax=Acrocarpospora catenulata TaxID=2836182 RepID=UPI001BD9AB4C|nr:S41 family peptidase [Acrocarpospora catenulata]
MTIGERYTFDPVRLALRAGEEPEEGAAEAEAAPVWQLTDLKLDDFLAGAGELSQEERLALVEQALVVLEGNYAHLPLKIAMHGVNPLQRLRLLQARVLRQMTGTPDPEWEFHSELLSIFHSVRDLHTLYLLPRPFADTAAVLPFRIEEAAEADGRSRYLVAGVDNPALLPQDLAAVFVKGVTVTHWNGVPIGRAVDRQGARFSGGNAAARHSRALASMTSRSLVVHLPPDEEWVQIGFLDLTGKPQELRMPWLVLRRTVPAAPGGNGVTAATRGVDLEGLEIANIRRTLLPPEQAAAVSASAYTATGSFLWRRVTTSTGTYGHIRIRDFDLGEFQTNDEFEAALFKFQSDFVTIATSLPEDGLILDIRGNPGGVILAGETLLQFLTPGRIQPEPAQLLNTPLNLRLGRQAPGVFGAWAPSMEQAVETGAVYSDAFPLTPVELANAYGQYYHGPVVLITDARCYSTADIFAAGFADHGIGTIIGVDGNTGAGGGNVLHHAWLRSALEDDQGTPYQELPKGADMTVAIRRLLRVGGSAGVPLEDLGVTPAVLHRMTPADVLQGNPDLMELAGRELAALPKRRLRVSAVPGDDVLNVTLDTVGLDRVDLWLDGRPRGSFDIGADPAPTVVVPGVVSAGVIRAEGYQEGAPAAVATVFL